jgi:peptide/nickel transport system substrate-binding protein
MRIAAAALALMILMAACSSLTPKPSTPTPTPTPTPYVPPRGLAPEEGTLRVAVTGAAPHRDLHQVVSEWATLFGASLGYSRIMRYVVGPGQPVPSLAVECDLCSDWREVDPLTYEFAIHPEARWQNAENFDSGPVTPQDVVWSLERLRTPGFPHTALLDSVDKIEPLIEGEVRLTLHHPDPDLPQKLASPYAVIMAPGSLDQVNIRTGRVVGSGPWRFNQGQSGQAKLTAWKGHYRELPQNDSIVFQPVANLDVGVQALLRDAVDMTQVTEEQWDALEGQGYRSVVFQRQGRGIAFGLNTRRAPFDDIEVRRSAFHALNPHAALAEIFGIGTVGVGVPGIDPSWLLPQDQLASAFDGPSDAPALFTLTVANFGEEYVAHGELLGGQLREAGFDVMVDVVPRGVYLNRVWTDRDYDAFVGPLPPTDTPNAFMFALLHTRGSSNVTGIGIATLDQLIEAQAVDLVPEARRALVIRVQEAALAQAAFFMPVISAERWAFSQRVEDVPAGIPGGSGDFWRHVRLAG